MEVREMDKSGSNEAAPKILIADDDPCVLGAVADRCARMGFDVSCIHKGRSFWTELENSLVMLYPRRAAAIRGSSCGSANIAVRQQPRVLLVDDDFGVKKFFFHQFQELGAELLHAADGVQGYWKARREQPTVIVADYCMPNGDAEYLLARLRSTPETRSIPVIVQSGRRLNDLIRRRLREQVC